MLGHDFVPHVHHEMCLQYVQKNFDGVYHEGYTLGEVRKAIHKHQFLREQEMQLLAPRGSFKSTTNMVDAVSWMLNAPDIRIMILSGEFKLAEKFMKGIKGYFNLSKGAIPTKFQQFFPEYTVDEKEATSLMPLLTPARVLPPSGEPTLWVNSIGSNLSGWHTDILKGDDVVTDENSNTDGTREKVNEKWTGALNLLDEWGFVDNIGTRYYIDDLFGERLKLIADVPLKFLKRSAWTVKPEFRTVKMEDLREDMVDLYFPEKLSFKSLRAKLLRNRTQFLCQQMNEPAGSEELVSFNVDDLRAAHEQLTAAPMLDSRGVRQEVFMTFDTSSGSQSGDFSAGAACVFQKREDGLHVMHVLEITFGKWKPSELSRQIVDFAFRWKPRVVLIEDWAGSELVRREISTSATQRGISIPILWAKRSMEYNAKKNRIVGLEILLATGRIKFVGGWGTDELMKQFTRYTGERVRRRSDDIPDAIAYLQNFMPDMTSSSAYEELKKAEKERTEHIRQAAHIFKAPLAPPTAVTPDTSSIDQQFFGGLGLYRN